MQWRGICIPKKVEWSQIKKTAFGVLALKPDEFWLLTPREFSEMIEGYEDLQEREMQKIAWQTANLMNIHIQKKKDKVTIDKLLGKKQKPQMSKLDIEKRMTELKKQLREGETNG